MRIMIMPLFLLLVLYSRATVRPAATSAMALIRVAGCLRVSIIRDSSECR